MDEAVSHLLSTGAMILGMLTFIGTFLLRRIVETAVPSAKKKADANEAGITYMTGFSRWWNEVILYALPAIVGACIGIANIEMIFTEVGFNSLSGRVVFGGVVGFFSGFIYKVVRKILKKTTGVDFAPERGGSIAASAPPPPPAD